jgi:hypothetical protein
LQAKGLGNHRRPRLPTTETVRCSHC